MKSILLSTQMVEATWEGRKTQHRWVIQARSGPWKGRLPLDVLPMKVPNEWIAHMQTEPSRGQVIKCRYGQVGDKLWVRETFCNECDPDSTPCYRANPEAQPALDFCSIPHWQPSTHMPQWASRITLEITGVRVQQIQSINREDVEAEGCSNAVNNPLFFPNLWDSLNAKQGHGWKANPWVWVIEFIKEGSQ